MEIQLCPVDPGRDFERLAELYNTAYNHPVSAADFASDYHQHGFLYRLVVAREAALSVATPPPAAGFSEVVRYAGNDPGHFHLSVVVDPAWRRQGTGRLLYEDALAFCAAQGAKRIGVRVREDCIDARRFAARRGFVEKRLQCELCLDLKSFDETPFREILPRMAEKGLRLTSMAELGDTQEARRALFVINNTTGRDIPGETSDSWGSFEEFEETVCRQSWYNPAGQFLAVVEKSGDFAGMCAMAFYENRRTAYNLHTGVYRAYRGQGLALALKLTGIRYAITRGALTLWTNNKPINAPMLAVNHKLGFQHRPGIYTLEKEL